jgi:hypothetical protein
MMQRQEEEDGAANQGADGRYSLPAGVTRTTTLTSGMPGSQIEERGKYIGSNLAGLSMIKDMVIRPLVIATEKVVEYYFPEDKPEFFTSLGG